MSPDQRRCFLTIPRGLGAPVRWDAAGSGVLQLVGPRAARHRAVRSVLVQAVAAGWVPFLASGVRWEELPRGARQVNTVAEIVGLVDTMRRQLGARYEGLEKGVVPAGTVLLVVDDVEGVLAALPSAGDAGKEAHQGLAALVRMGGSVGMPVVLAGDRCLVRPYLSDLSGARRLAVSSGPYRVR